MSQRKDAIAEKREWESLQKHPAWIRLEAWLGEELEMATNEVMLIPVGEKMGITEQEFRKGEASMARKLLVVIHSYIEQCEAIIEATKDEDETDE